MKLRSYIIFQLLITILFSGNCIAQTYNFNYLTAKEGLSQSEVTCFLEDNYGFLWIGTLDGLNKYDGYNIETFNTDRNNKNSLTNNTIRALKEDTIGRIWIGTDNGLCMYNPLLDKIERITINTGTSKKIIINSLLVVDDLLYITTNNGLYSLNLKTNTYPFFDKTIKPISVNFGLKQPNLPIEKIIESFDGSFWILESNALSRVLIKENTAHIIEKKMISIGEFSGFKDFCEDYLGNLWIVSTSQGVYRYTPDSNTITHFLNDNNPNSLSSNWCSDIVADKENNIWIATIDNGINKIEAHQLSNKNISFKRFTSIANNQYGLNSNLILSLYVSKDNLLWVGTIAKGVDYFNPNQKQIKNYTIPNINNDASTSSNFIRAIYEENDMIWIGTHNNGLYLLNRKTEKYKKLGFENQSIFYIEKYDQDKLFICGNNGISLVSVKNNNLTILDTYKTSATFNIIKSNNFYWAATLKGILKLEVINNKILVVDTITTESTQKISLDNCRVLYFQKNNNTIWVGTEGGGLNEIKLNKDEAIVNILAHTKSEDSTSISNNYIRSIYEDTAGNLWIGTYEGLNKLEKDNSGNITFTAFTKSNGLPNNMIQSIEGQENSDLWIGTNGGLSNFNQQTLTFKNFTQSDGLQSNEFSEHTSFKTKKGEFIFGGINGISAFFTGNMTESKIMPKTRITEFYLFNNLIKPGDTIKGKVLMKQSVIGTDSITLSPRQNNFKLNFSAMHLFNPNKLKYAYKLEGYDDDWIYTDANNRTASYTNLNNGNYLFKVKSTNSDGIWELEGDSLFINIKTPFYKTWWAYLFYTMLFFVILFYWTRFSIIKITTKKQIILESDHNKKLHDLDELRTKFFINVSHDLRTPLTLISSPIENLLEKDNLTPKTKKQLHLVKLNIDRLKYLTEQLLDIRKIESNKFSPKIKGVNILEFATTEANHFQLQAEDKGLYLNIETDFKKTIVNFDTDIMSKVFFNILSNCFKFTEFGGITIALKTDTNGINKKLKSGEKQNLVITFEDTGIGIPEEHLPFIFDRFHNLDTKIGKGYNIGLSHCKELIENAGGEIKTESVINQGTKVTVYLPNSIDYIDTFDTAIQKQENNASGNNIEEANSKALNHKKRLLIVEDNKEMLSYIESELIESYVIYKASDGLMGLTVALKQLPDLIISDIMMPKMDGIELCQKLKTNIQSSHIPIILLTASTDIQTKYQGIENGADDYISKPFEMKYLKVRIENLLNIRENLKNLFKKNITFGPSSVEITPLDEKFLKELTDALELNLADPEFKITNLENLMGMSHANFYRKIKNITGMSGKEILQNFRMQRAFQLLQENKDLRISEVAYMVGFTNPRYFSKCFKNQFNMLPSDF